MSTTTDDGHFTRNNYRFADLHFRLEGREPVMEPDPEAWSLWKDENFQDRIVDVTIVDEFHDCAKVSTVFTGINTFPGRRSPMIFETMVFWGGSSDEDFDFQ